MAPAASIYPAPSRRIRHAKLNRVSAANRNPVAGDE